MKVAFTLTQSAHAVPGGTGVAAVEMLNALKAQTDAVDIVAVGAGRIRRGEPLSLPDPSVEYPMPYPVLYELWNRTNRGSIERLVPDADVVHLTVALCPARRRAPQVVTVHDVFPYTYPEMLTKRGARVLRDGLDRVIERADLIVTSSAASADELCGHGAELDRIRVVPLGAKAQSFTDGDLDEVRKRYGLAGPFVLFAGTIEPRKNLDVLLSAMERTDSDTHLVLVGPVGWGDVAHRIPAVGSDRIHVLGKLPRRDLLGLMSAAAAVCMPSHAEGFGLPALEAMAQGTPVIHSATPALQEVVGDAGPSVAVDDVVGWAREMSSFTADGARSVELGAVALERARPSSWERTAQRMRAVYEELA